MPIIDATDGVTGNKKKKPVQTPAQIAQGMKVAAMLGLTGTGGQGAEGEWGILNDTEAKNAGLVTDRSALLATVPKGSDGNAPQTLGDVVLRGASSRKKPASIATTPSTTRGRAPSVAGKTANSAGAFYGSSGTDISSTSVYDGGVDRTGGLKTGGLNTGGGGLYDDLMSYLDPTSIIDRQKKIREELENSRQSQLDAIKQKYSSQMDQRQQQGQEDLARMRSMNLRAGLGGSDFGAANKQEVREGIRKDFRAMEANRDLEIGGVINEIDQLAQQQFQIEQNAMRQNFSTAMEYQQFVQGQQQMQRKNTVDRVAELGKAGLDLVSIKQRDPQLYQNLTAASGMGDVELEAVLNNNKPAPAKIDYQYKVAGGRLIAFGVDPATNQMKVIEQDAGLPDNYKTLIADDGTILGIPENWDGDTSKIVTVGNYRKPFASEMGGGGDISTAGLSPLAQSIYENPALIQNLTPTEKGKVLKELAGNGLDLQNFATEKLNAAQREQIAGFDDLIREANNAADVLATTKLDVGPIASRAKAVGAAFGFQPDYTQYRSIIDNFGSALLKLRSGAAVTPQEFTRIAGFIPATTDDESTAQTKINRFIEEMTKAQQNYINRATQTTQQIQSSVIPQQTDDIDAFLNSI